MENNFIIKGDICFSEDLKNLNIFKNSYLICLKGRSIGVFQDIPEKYKNLEVKDYGNNLIIPGITDLHIHAPQYDFRGTGMDLELLEWLEKNTFPEEAKFKNLAYANKAYEIFTKDLKKSVTTRACIFATLHKEATLLLMDKLETSGLVTMVGKINMNRNAPKILIEESEDISIQNTLDWLERTKDKGYNNTYPILTPRFTPSCTDELMKKLKKIQKMYNLPLQSHLSENPNEIEWVKELCPWIEVYADSYKNFDLLGNECKTIMAHCVYSGEKEIKILKERGVFIAHCPESNINLSSGIAPVRRFLNSGINIGLGSDIAGGARLNMLFAMAQAIQVSKLYWRLQDKKSKPLCIEEVFYMATIGGGSFFGKVGSFKKDYEFDAIVIDDASFETTLELSIKERLERVIYLGDERNIKAKYVRGKKIL